MLNSSTTNNSVSIKKPKLEHLPPDITDRIIEMAGFRSFLNYNEASKIQHEALTEIRLTKALEKIFTLDKAYAQRIFKLLETRSFALIKSLRKKAILENAGIDANFHYSTFPSLSFDSRQLCLFAGSLKVLSENRTITAEELSYIALSGEETTLQRVATSSLCVKLKYQDLLLILERAALSGKLNIAELVIHWINISSKKSFLSNLGSFYSLERIIQTIFYVFFGLLFLSLPGKHNKESIYPLIIIVYLISAFFLINAIKIFITDPFRFSLSKHLNAARLPSFKEATPKILASAILSGNSLMAERLYDFLKRPPLTDVSQYRALPDYEHLAKRNNMTEMIERWKNPFSLWSLTQAHPPSSAPAPSFEGATAPHFSETDPYVPKMPWI